jgi:hypothetical protein
MKCQAVVKGSIQFLQDDKMANAEPATISAAMNTFSAHCRIILIESRPLSRLTWFK